MRLRLILLAAAVLLTAAVGPDDADRPDLAPHKAAIEEGRAAEAAEALVTLLAFHPEDADILNLLGFAHRKLGKLPEARGFYDRALAADRFHLGAHEYKGELELMEGNLAAARDHLERLELLCPGGCEELEDLREAFAEAGITP